MTAFTTYRLDISGFDRQGIVAAISDILSAKEVNVASLESRRVFAPESGTPMFLMNAELQISSQVSLQELQHSLQSYCDEEALELLLEMIG